MPIESIAKEYKANQFAQQVAPPPTYPGVTAENVIAGGGNMSKAEYAIRGGRGNTAMSAIQQAKNAKRQKSIQKMYEDLISRREEGAKILYKDAIDTYGEGVAEYIPPIDLFYGDDGMFQPHNYAKSVKVGLDKYKESDAKRKEEERKRQEEERKRQEEEARKQRLLVQQQAMYGAKPNTSEEAYRAGAFSTIGEPLEEGAADLAKYGWPGQRDLWQNYRAGKQDIATEEDINRLITAFRTRKAAIESQLSRVPKNKTNPNTLEPEPNPQHIRLQNELDQLDIDINAMKSKRKQITGNRYKQAEEEIQRKRAATQAAEEAAIPPPQEDKPGFFGSIGSTIGGWIGGDDDEPEPQSAPQTSQRDQAIRILKNSNAPVTEANIAKVMERL